MTSVRCRPPLGSAREVPGQPAIDVPEQGVAGLRLGSCAGDILEQPGELEAGEIGGERQARPGAQTVLATFLRELRDKTIRARVLPDDRVVQRFSRSSVPNEGGFALIGDADRGKVAWREPSFPHRSEDDALCVAPDLGRVMLDPSGPRVELLVFLLIVGDDVAFAVEDDEARARRSLIDRTYVVRQGMFPVDGGDRFVSSAQLRAAAAPASLPAPR